MANNTHNEPLQTLGGKLHSHEDEIKLEKNSSSFSTSSCSSCNDKIKICEEENVGGQAIIEGIMMRRKDSYALAVRLPNGTIQVEKKKWFSFSKSSFKDKPFLRGFPLLIETLINGIRTLNRSAELNSQDDEKPINSTQLFFTLLAAILMAIGLFVVLPHFLSALMQYLDLSGDVDTFSFQVWDGLFKFLVFFCYIAAISFIPEIKRVFQFHGAEHKVIAAYEKCNENQVVDINLAKKQSRLHPRCGTTFLLFVLSFAIIIHTIFLPFFFWLWVPESTFIKHALTLFIKIILMVPIASLAYELIKYSARLNSFWGNILKAPGLFLQYFTTKEPDDEHLEVALVALKEALGEESKHEIKTTDYILL